MKKLIFLFALFIPSVLFAATFDGTTFTKIDGVTVTKWNGMTVGTDVTAPTLSTSTIGTNGTTWTEVFSESVSVGAGGNAGWSGSCSTAGAITLTYSSGSGTSSLVYTGSPTVNSGDTCTIAYTQPGNGIEDAAGNDLATIASHAVTNNSTQGSCGDSSCTGFEVCQNFETATTGYDNGPESWAVTRQTGDTYNPAYTTTHLRGNQSLLIAGAGTGSTFIVKTFNADQSEIYGHMLVEFVNAAPSSDRDFVYIQDSGGATLAELRLKTTGALSIICGGQTVNSSAGLFANGTAYHLWYHYKAGTGANGIFQAWVTATTTDPTGGAATASITNGTNTASARKLRLNEYNGVTGGTIFDQVLVKTSAIGDVCN